MQIDKIKIGEKARKIRTEHKLTQQELANLFAVKQETISQIELGKIAPSLEIINHYINKFSINYNDFILNSSSMIRHSDNNRAVVVGHSSGIPLISLDAVAGLGVAGKYNITDGDIEARYYIPAFEKKNPDYLIRIDGSSMYPKYNGGDIVACRLIRDIHYIQWTKPHIIYTTSQGSLCKRIVPSDKENHVRLLSDNTKYIPFDVPTSDIQHLSLIIGVIRLE